MAQPHGTAVSLLAAEFGRLGATARWWNASTYVPLGSSTTTGSPAPSDAVVFGELYAKTPCLDADHRIQLGVEIRRTPENLGRDLIFLDRRSRVIQDMFGKVAQQFAQRLRAMQDMAVHQPVDLSETLLSFRQRNLVTTRLKGV